MTKRISILYASILLFTANPQLYAQTVPGLTGSKVTQAQAQEALDFHNKVRADVKVPGLQWSAELAAFAQQWAEQVASKGCGLQHRPGDGEWAQKYGENIFGGSGAAYTALNASESWYAEIKDYTPGALNESNWYKTGHYTQMVWRNTTQAGIGIATCEGNGTIIVANYNTPGNYMGESPY